MIRANRRYVPSAHRWTRLEAFLTSYGLAAACAVMLVKAVGVPIPIPGDVILLALAARAAEGKVLLWVAFVALLAVLTVGGTVQYWLARGPARQRGAALGGRLGITPERLERVAARVRRGGLLGIGLAVLTPGVRSAAIPGCGLAGIRCACSCRAWRWAAGSTSRCTSRSAMPAPACWRRSCSRRRSCSYRADASGWRVAADRAPPPHERAVALNGWAQATCPVCLVLGGVNALESEGMTPAPLRYAERVSASAPQSEDARVWIGRVSDGHEAEHEQFLAWLNGEEAHEIFRRRRLNEYTLSEQDGMVTIVFKAPHTGDPRLMIDVLRYPGLWPSFWEFERGGRAEDEPLPTMPPDSVKVHWLRDA